MSATQAIRENDHSAFSQVYEKFHRDIYRFIFMKSKSEFVAQEVTQLTFIKLWGRRHTLDVQTPIEVQLFGMARQVMIDELRKESVRFRHEGQSAETPLTDNLIEALESKDLMQLMEQDIAQMPRVRKLVFELSRNKGMSHKEIAYMLDMSTKNVEQHINKALGQLKRHLYSIKL